MKKQDLAKLINVSRNTITNWEKEKIKQSIFKNDINSEIDESIIMNKFNTFFKNMNFLNGIEMMVKKEKIVE